ncbi:hypothetical protein JCM1840_002890 [Sporobolomyces johnsonii]
MGEHYYDDTDLPDVPAQHAAGPSQPYQNPPAHPPPGLTEVDSPYFPWLSREFMLVDILVHSANGQISQAQLDSIILVTKEITPRAIPSLHQLCQFHEALKLTVSYFVPTLATAPSGCTLHCLKPQDAVSSVFSTPNLHNSLTLYPEEPFGSISSIN